MSAIHSIAQEIIIQENEIGFCSVDGSVQTSVSGYTGSIKLSPFSVAIHINPCESRTTSFTFAMESPSFVFR